jgi:hypothetical protein
VRRFSQIPLVLMYLLSACRQDVERKVVQAVRSPDGVWLAKEVHEQHFGPGTAGYIVSVTLTRSGDNGPGDFVLALEPPQDHAPDPRAVVAIQWNSPTNLQLSYGGAPADTVVSRFAGVDINVVRKARSGLTAPRSSAG